MDVTLRTPRLTLRPFSAADTERVWQIENNWNVARMLRMAVYPPDRDVIAAWLSTHEAERREGTAYRFALVSDGRVIGCTDVDQIKAGDGSLGYWLDEACWGRGLATEAAQAVVAFAVSQLKLQRLVSGHASDNPASGRVLEKLGFRRTGEGEVLSKARKATIRQLWYEFLAPQKG